jgi:hypothetical protein
MSPYALAGVAAVVALVLWYAYRRTERVPCSLDLERTHDHLHAHVELEGAEPEPGDAVRVEDAPTRLEYGEKRRMESAATIRHASWPRRQMAKILGTSHIHDLYDVGFE